MILLALPTHAGEYAGYGYQDYVGGYAPDDGYGRVGYYRHHRRYPSTHCAYGPFYQRKVCDWSPPYCWKERECYYIHGHKYCRYYTKCDGGRRRCHWIPNYGHRSCYDPYY